MKVFREPPDIKKVFITIGNFDGVHIGHQKVLKIAKQRSSTFKKKLVAVTFWPHPSNFFGKGVKLIQTIDQRLMSLRDFVDFTLVLPFQGTIAGMEPLDFLNFIYRRMPFQEVFIGKGFRFGKGRMGDALFLKKVGREKGFVVWDIEKVFYGGEKVSSSRIRKLLEEGRVNEAAILLGRPYCIEGIRIKGRGLGSSMGFPTVNILPENSILPRGVFAGFVKHGKELHRAAVYIGSRPTFGESMVLAEAYSVDGELNVKVGERVSIFLINKLREEKRFSDIDELKRNIERDVAKVLSG